MPEGPDEFTSCGVCGRTILKGEQVHVYVAAQGQRVGVCSLCRSRAEASGLIPAERVGTVARTAPARQRRGQALRRRLGQAAARARPTPRESHVEPARESPPVTPREPAVESQGSADAPPEPAGGKAAEGPPKRRTRQQPKQGARQQAKRQPRQAPKAGGAPRKTRPRRGPEAIMRRAVEHFNGSDEPRKVAGLIRSLGEPQAAVRPDPRRQLALVTVAWELSWYQWEVSGDGDGEPVREVAKGKEVSELSEEARVWNAAVAEDGSIRLHPSAARRKQSGKQA